MTKLTYEDEYQIIEIAFKKEDMNLSEFMEDIAEPLIATVYNSDLFDKWCKGV